MDYPQIVIKNRRIEAIRRRHPWIFSGAIASMPDCADGDLVEVVSSKGEYLATGYYHDGSIAIRILSFERRPIDVDFWKEKLKWAFDLRQRIGFPSERTNAFRLIHGEGDGLPGLIIDIYNDTAVIQCHSIGMHIMRDMIASALDEVSPIILTSIYDKSNSALPKDYAGVVEDGPLKGEASHVQILENGHAFNINYEDGQKTGFFLDQRDNRHLLGLSAKGQKVLNLYAYTGGFSIYALSAGADKVYSVDVSKKAVDLLNDNVALTGLQDKHESLAQDVTVFLKECPQDHYDIIILDPPAFAKSLRKRHNAVQAYKRINAAAMKKIRKGGLIFTFSCSQVVDTDLFYNTVTSAAIEAQRSCQVLHRLSQGADHPVSLFHPEGEYLKGLVLRVE